MKYGKQVIVYDLQRGGIPDDVSQEVEQMWVDNELGNDHCYFQWDHEEYTGDYPAIAAFILKDLEGRTSSEDETILIHWWW